MAAISTFLHSSVPITPKYLSALRIQLLVSTPSNDGKSSGGNWGGWSCWGGGSFWRYGGVLNEYCGGTNGNPLEVEARFGLYIAPLHRLTTPALNRRTPLFPFLSPAATFVLKLPNVLLRFTLPSRRRRPHLLTTPPPTPLQSSTATASPSTNLVMDLSSFEGSETVLSGTRRDGGWLGFRRGRSGGGG
ncbi:hypothetical protein Droror1_Dr00020791 [Drosera rotundifolia]